jgi:hypothetical protein
MKAFGPFHTHRAVFAAEINRLCSLELTAEQVGNRVKSRDYKSLTLALPAGTKHRAPTPEELAAKQLSSNTQQFKWAQQQKARVGECLGSAGRTRSLFMLTRMLKKSKTRQAI